jgi:HTH-type transcriptional regulator/antitoxin HigA
MAIRTTSHVANDIYFNLIRRFPLTHIRDDGHLAKAAAMIDELLQEDLDYWAQEYLDALTDLVEVYESQHVVIPDAPPADVLAELMRSNGISQNQLSKNTGIAQSTISAVLSGRRALTTGHMVKLGEFFNVPPAVFLPVGS